MSTFRTSDLIGRIGDNLFLISGLELTEAPDDIMERRLKKFFDDHNNKRQSPYPIYLTMAGANWIPSKDEHFESVVNVLEDKLQSK
ncbi:hypothetical protein MCHI_000894 [Candidatus Magnetoovum chiemensis]|nr:hypothetical protein MCHI_000894 [Candidatus Magnetoovum chiemensis]